MSERRNCRVVVNPFHDAAENRTCSKTTHSLSMRFIHKHKAYITRIFERSKPDKRSHLQIAIVRASFLIVLFSRTRLAAKQHVGKFLRSHLLCRTAIHHTIEHFTDGCSRLFRNHTAKFHRFNLFHDFTLGVTPFLHNLRAHELAAVCNSRISHHHLDRRHRNSMTKAHRLERSIVASKFSRLQKSSTFFANVVVKSPFANAKSTSHSVHTHSPHFRGNLCKHNIRGLHHRFAHVHIAIDMGIANSFGLRVPFPAFAFVGINLLRTDNMVFKSGRSRNHLER